jgi:hypothetical protein
VGGKSSSMSIQGGNSIKDIDYLLMDNSQLGFE